MTNNEYHEHKQVLDSKIRDILVWTGSVVALIAMIVYVAAIVVMVLGFNQDVDLTSQILFILVGIACGLAVDMSLWGQGKALAKRVSGVQEKLLRYEHARNRKIKKPRNYRMWVYDLQHVISVLFTKGVTVALVLYGIIHVAIVGNEESNLIILAIANAFMFLGFGLISMAKGYDKFLEKHIPAIEEATRRYEEQNHDRAGSVPLPSKD
jgi:hypothetical protein